MNYLFELQKKANEKGLKILECNGNQWNNWREFYIVVKKDISPNHFDIRDYEPIYNIEDIINYI